jgi:Na+/proline symporter
LLTGMLTTFVYARLWRRIGVTTDLAFYELRYSGRPAAFLRGFRAVYLGILFNVLVMATVTLAAIKIGGVMLGLSPLQTVAVASLVTVAFSAAGGLTGVLLTDALLFVVAMAGSVVAAVVAVRHPAVGGLEGLFAHPAVADRLALMPDPGDPAVFVPLFIVPLAVQWWASWYPGSEPGGGGYLAQRMLAARSERHALGATLMFNVAHYALRPWPWILVALASLIVFPDLASLARAFPAIPAHVIGHDLAYPAMLTLLPTGALGLVVASLAAAFMSTISTHLNWGASYLAHDVYQRFVDPQASERTLVRVGRVTTVLLMVLAAMLALQLENALQAFGLLLQIGAGTGLLFILRWFWWRINAWSEITAMVVSFAIALFFVLQHRALAKEGHEPTLLAWQELLIGVAATTVAWVVVTFITRPTDPAILRAFCRLARPGGPGWHAVHAAEQVLATEAEPEVEPWPVPRALFAMLLGSAAVYSLLFATGHALYGHLLPATLLLALAAASTVALIRLRP